MKTLYGLLVAGGSAAVLQAQAPPAPHPHNEVVARASDVKISRELVRYVATNAERTKFEHGSRPDLERLTPAGVAQILCGSVQDGYLEMLGIEVDPGLALGERVYAIAWPACLYATDATQSRKYILEEGETLSQAWQRLTGLGEATAAVWRERTIRSGAGTSDPTKIPATTALNLPVTAPTVLSTSLPAQEFREGIERRSGNSPVQVDLPDSAGEIIVPMESEFGAIATTLSDCVQGPPFDPAAVANAFDFAVRNGDQLDNIRVVIVDNGFFGVECNLQSCPPVQNFHSAYFPSPYFERFMYRETSGLGPIVLSNVNPVNYRNFKQEGHRYSPADVNETSGHGTHVAGLVLGGESFLPYRKDVFPAGISSSWLKLIIFNVANGRREIGPKTEDSIFSNLAVTDGIKIVNMSIVIKGTAASDTIQKFEKAINDASDILFVVAAGNQPRDLAFAGSMPATLGGMDGKPNVLTVASVDGDNRLSPFSAYGKQSDLAAPGCKVKSWVDGTANSKPASGTSQAAPIVTFAAALLRHSWQARPAALKKRLIYSGDLILCPPDQNGYVRCVSSAVKLNPWKALLIDRDVVTSGGATWLGRFETSGEMWCGPTQVQWNTIHSIKRLRPDGPFLIFYSIGDGNLRSCPGELRVGPATPDGAGAHVIHHSEKWTGSAVPEAGEKRPLSSEIEEIVFRARQPVL